MPSNYPYAPDVTWPTFGPSIDEPGDLLPRSPTSTTRGRGIRSPEALAAMISGGLGVGSALLQGRQAGKDREQSLAALLAGISGDQADDQLRRQQAHMATFAMDPVSQSRDLFSANALRDFAMNGAPRVSRGAGGVENRFSPSEASMGFLSPDALAENASRFYAAAGALDPYALRPELGAMGFGEAGASRQGGMEASIQGAQDRYEQAQRQRREDLLRSIQAQQPKKSGGFSWGKLLAGLGIGASAFIPGLPAAVAPALLGAGGSLAMGASPGQAAVSGATAAGTDYFNRR